MDLEKERSHKNRTFPGGFLTTHVPNISRYRTLTMANHFLVGTLLENTRLEKTRGYLHGRVLAQRNSE